MARSNLSPRARIALFLRSEELREIIGNPDRDQIDKTEMMYLVIQQWKEYEAKIRLAIEILFAQAKDDQ